MTKNEKNLFLIVLSLSVYGVLFGLGTYKNQNPQNELLKAGETQDIQEVQEVQEIVTEHQTLKPLNCKHYTQEQIEIIQKAYKFGEPKDYGYTLAAISVQESFLGDRILRVNPNDPSFGITHIHFNTIKYLGKKSHYQAIQESEELIKNDELSWKYSIKKLDSIKGTFYNKWRRYNGTGIQAEKYAQNIQRIIKEIKTCNIL